MASNDDDLDSILASLDDDNVVQVKSSEKVSKAEEEENPPLAVEKPIPQKEAPPKVVYNEEFKEDLKRKTKSFFTLHEGHKTLVRVASIALISGFITSCFTISAALAFLSYNAPATLNAQNVPLSSLVINVPKAPQPVSLNKNLPQTHETNYHDVLTLNKENAEHGDVAPYDFYRVNNPPHTTNSQNKIAIIIADIGLNDSRLQNVFKEAPSMTTLAFTPYADIVKPASYNSKNYEYWMMLPTERTNEAYDPGALGLYNSRDITLNNNALTGILNRQSAFTGFVVPPYSALPEEREQYQQIMSRIYELGYGVFDASFLPVSPDVLTMGKENFPYFQIDVLIDADLTPETINAAFRKLEIIASENSHAIGLMNPYPISIELYKYWAKSLDERGFVLVPLSAIFKKSGTTKLSDLNQGHEPSHEGNDDLHSEHETLTHSAPHDAHNAPHEKAEEHITQEHDQEPEEHHAPNIETPAHEEHEVQHDTHAPTSSHH